VVKIEYKKIFIIPTFHEQWLYKDYLSLKHKNQELAEAYNTLATDIVKMYIKGVEEANPDVIFFECNSKSFKNYEHLYSELIELMKKRNIEKRYLREEYSEDLKKKLEDAYEYGKKLSKTDVGIGGKEELLWADKIANYFKENPNAKRGMVIVGYAHVFDVESIFRDSLREKEFDLYIADFEKIFGKRIRELEKKRKEFLNTKTLEEGEFHPQSKG
jgi:hypothetical protein